MIFYVDKIVKTYPDRLSIPPVKMPHWILIVGISLGLIILATIITAVVIITARRSAVKVCRDVKGDKSESVNRGVRSEYKVRLLWNKLESNPIFFFFF